MASLNVTIKRPEPLDLMPWYIKKGDGLNQNCMLVAVIENKMIQSISLAVDTPPKKGMEDVW